MADDLRIAFVAGLSEHKLKQKLEPLASLESVSAIDLYRRRPWQGEFDKVTWRPIPKLFRAAPLAEGYRFLDLLCHARRYDVIVGCFQIMHGYWAHLAGRLAGVPVIQLVITDVDWNMARPLARRAMLSAAACGVRGPSAVERLSELGFSGPVRVIHNPYSIQSVEGATNATPKYDLIAVGDAAIEKDYSLMFTVLAKLRSDLPDLRVAIVGAGHGKFRAEVAAKGLTKTIDFLGRLEGDDLDQAYAASRALILTSSVEGLPMVVVEAMAHGLPVVVTDVGDLSWLVKDGVHGRVVPHGDVAAIAAAVASVLAGAGADDMATAAQTRVRELATTFSTSAIASEWAGLLAHTTQ